MVFKLSFYLTLHGNVVIIKKTVAFCKLEFCQIYFVR